MQDAGLSDREIRARVDEAKTSEPYPTPKTACSLKIRFGAGNHYSAPHKVAQKLSIEDGVCHHIMDKHLSHPRIQSFIHADSNVLVLKVSGVSALVDSRQRVELFRFREAGIDAPRHFIDGDTAFLEQTLPDGFKFVVAARIACDGSLEHKEKRREFLRKEIGELDIPTPCWESDEIGISASVVGGFELFLAVATSKETDDPKNLARKILESAARKGFSLLLERQAEWWREFWSKSNVELEDQELERIWRFSLYSLASSYRSVPVPALCGLWFGPTDDHVQILPWRGVYTNDQNSQIVPMPLFASNHPELVENFLDTFLAMLPEARKTAGRLFDFDGALMPESCDPSGKDVSYYSYYMHSAGPYLGLIFRWAWLYSKDERLLKEKIYPFIKDVCVFFAEMMRLNDSTGKYELYPSTPPEYHKLFMTNPVPTISMLKAVMTTALEAAERFDVDRGIRGKWKDILARFPEYPTEDGVVLDGAELSADHYMSQAGGLFPIFPCGESGVDSDENTRRLYLKTFEDAFKRSAHISYADDNGFHFTNHWVWFKLNMAALRLGLKERSMEILRHYGIRCFLKPNMLVAHNAAIVADSTVSEENMANIPDEYLRDGDTLAPMTEFHYGHDCECTENPEALRRIFPVLEGNSSFLMVITEMLLQSHGGLIRLFPGWPLEKHANFADLRAEGAFLVSAELADGVVKHVGIKSLAGGTARIADPWNGDPVVVLNTNEETEKIFDVEDGVVVVETQPDDIFEIAKIVF
jgi:hypothetical protein